MIYLYGVSIYLRLTLQYLSSWGSSTPVANADAQYMTNC